MSAGGASLTSVAALVVIVLGAITVLKLLSVSRGGNWQRSEVACPPGGDSMAGSCAVNTGWRSLHEFGSGLRA
jgi:hypothetical protein